MSTSQIAFFIGLFGSIHCIGMCGPLAFAIPVSAKNWWILVIDKVIYNLGRIVSYVALGLIIGMAGRQLWLSGLQRGVSFISGLLIIMAGLSRLLKISVAKKPVSKLLSRLVNRWFSYALQHRAGHLLIGMLNGFLPCGFVYLALVGAINTQSPIQAGMYMFWFGMGTFPLMLLATIGSGFINPTIRRHINKTIPYFMILLGFWFVLRASGLNIPYLSVPVQQISGACG